MPLVRCDHANIMVRDQHSRKALSGRLLHVLASTTLSTTCARIFSAMLAVMVKLLAALALTWVAQACVNISRSGSTKSL